MITHFDTNSSIISYKNSKHNTLTIEYYHKDQYCSLTIANNLPIWPIISKIWYKFFHKPQINLNRQQMIELKLFLDYVIN